MNRKIAGRTVRGLVTAALVTAAAVVSTTAALAEARVLKFAHVLQTITNLSNGDHQLLVHWFRSLETERLGGIVRQEL